MSQYDDYIKLAEEFIKALGYCNRLEIPEALVRRIAEFCDAHPEDMMTAYYVTSLLEKFYRKRTRERSIQLFDSLNSHLRSKKFLMEVFSHHRLKGLRLFCTGGIDASAIWLAIDDFEEGYEKANHIGNYADLLAGELAESAYRCAKKMSGAYKIRALAGIYPVVDEVRKALIFRFIAEQFAEGSPEAAYRLKLLFPYLDRRSKSEVISRHLGTPSLPDAYLAYLVIRNASSFDADDAKRIAVGVRTIRSDYLKNRCLLKLASHLSMEEIEGLYLRFLESFHTQEASSELVHNLYHFSAVIKTLAKDEVIHLALQKIAGFDDSRKDYFEQSKYSEMMFITPHLAEEHRELALAIAATVRGGYRRTLLAKLTAHFSNTRNFCVLRGTPISN